MGDTTLFPTVISFTNGFYRIVQATNANYSENVDMGIMRFETHPTNANFFYAGTIALDFTLVTSPPNPGATRETMIQVLIALATGTVISGTVAVSNFPATQPVSGTVTANQGTSPWVSSVPTGVNVNNFPATQPVSGTVAATQSTSPWVVSGSSTITPSIPVPGDIVGASRASGGTLYTVPIGRTFYGQLSLSATISVVGNDNPSVMIANVGAGTGAAPTGTVFQLDCSGLALATLANANTVGNVYVFGGTAGATITFVAGAAGNSTGCIAGRLL